MEKEIETSLGSFASNPEAPSTDISNSIIKIGKNLPFIELFEGFLVVGSVLFFNSLSFYFLLNTWSNLLSSDPEVAAKAPDMAAQAARLQSVWIAIGLVVMLVGLAFYYLHRRSQRE